MLGGRLDFLEKKGAERVLVGFDLGNKYSQISYCLEGSEVPETLSLVAGSESYNIPTVLCKRQGVNQWFFGREAYKFAEEYDGILIENLVDLAKSGEKIYIEAKEFDPIALLTLFVKRSLSLLSGICTMDKIGGVMFTCDELDRDMVDVLAKVSGALDLKTKNVCFQGHVESTYYYNIYQPRDLWNQQVIVCDCDGERMKTYRMECNKRTTPVVVFIDPMEFPFTSIAPNQKDRDFLEILQELCDERIVSCIYLLGEGFYGQWMQESLKFMCKNRRVFQGNNLFSKGACYSLLEKQHVSAAGREHVFLGNEKLKSNIGMKVQRRGMDSYLALLDAGTNWFEAGKEVDFLLESGDSFGVLITPLNGRDVKVVEVTLEELEIRERATTRIRLMADMISEDKVQLRMEDLGFGEIYPASHAKWRKIIEV